MSDDKLSCSTSPKQAMLPPESAELVLLSPQDLEQQISQLKKQQQLQHQMLLQHFQAQQQQLAEQHEAQLRHHLKKYWEQQKLLEEQQQREREKLEAIKKKERHEQSAVASSEVKQKLQSFLIKKQREAAAISPNSSCSSVVNNDYTTTTATSGGGPLRSSISYKNCYEVLKQQNPTGTNSTNAQGYTFDPGSDSQNNDFPLRKTASEPNLLKVRIKQRVMERRSSPMIKRHERLFTSIKKKSQQIANCTVSPNSISGSQLLTGERCSPNSVGSTPIKEEDEENNGPLRKSNSHNSVGNLTLFSSPSMPNISIGNPLHLLPVDPNIMLSSVSEAQTNMCGQRLGMTIAGQLPYAAPRYPPPSSAVGGESTSPRLSIVNEYHQDELMAEPPIPQALSRLKKQSIRPLGRTQSSPLPLAHPVLRSPNGGPVLSPPNAHGIAQNARSITMNTPNPMLVDQHPPEAHINYSTRYRIDYAPYCDDDKVIDLTGHHADDKKETIHENDVTMRPQFQYEHMPHMLLTSSNEISSSTSSSSLNSSSSSSTIVSNNAIINHHPQSVIIGHHARPYGRPLSRAVSSPLVHHVTPGFTHYGQMHVGHHVTAPALPIEQLSSLHSMSMHSTDIPVTSVNLSMRKRQSDSPHRITTGLAFDNLMLKHACICGNNSNHPEHAGRLQSIWARLMETGLISRCDRMRARKATIEELQTCHTEVHSLLFGTNPVNRQKMDMSKLSKLPIKSFVRLSCGGIGVDADTTWNEIHTAPAARMAVGSVVDLAVKTQQGDINNGFAIVRPPGHHAESAQAMGFCFFNSVAIAARILQQRFLLHRILIVDWDVHHGNGTQQIFYDDPRVLVISIHRHDDGNFFPGTGSPTECGIGPGVGYNVNIAWSGGLNPPLSDAEYLAAFRSVVMPIAMEFSPDIVLVSAGFDACSGHPQQLGGYKVSPACFGYMTKELMSVCDGKIILALEGGYNLPAICDSAEECVRVLLGDAPCPIRNEELIRPPCQNAIDTLQKTIAIQLSHWPCIKAYAHVALCSHADVASLEKDESETVTAMASLSMKQNSIINIHSRMIALSEPMEK